jgi:hypothetical protein
MALRMTVQTLLILQALLQNPGRELYGLELAGKRDCCRARRTRSFSAWKTRDG